MAASWWLIVLSWNGREDTLACLRSLRALRDADTEVVCVDNGSTDGSVEAVRAAHPEVDLVENGRNLGFAGGNNAGLRHALRARRAVGRARQQRRGRWRPTRSIACAPRRRRAPGGRHARGQGLLRRAARPHLVRRPALLAGLRLLGAPARLRPARRRRATGAPTAPTARPAPSWPPRGAVVDARRPARRRPLRLRRGRRLVLSRARGRLRDLVRPRRRSPGTACRPRPAASAPPPTPSTTACATRSPSPSATCRCRPRCAQLRRWLILAVFLFQALALSERRRPFVAAVRDGYRDALAGRFGERPARSSSSA